jgi:hypothetical protein
MKDEAEMSAPMLDSQEPAAWAAFEDESGESGVTALNREAVEEVAARMGWQVAALYRKPMLEQDERAALLGLACYLDTRGSIQLQAWGSLLRVLLARFS